MVYAFPALNLPKQKQAKFLGGGKNFANIKEKGAPLFGLTFRLGLRSQRQDVPLKISTRNEFYMLVFLDNFNKFIKIRLSQVILRRSA